VDVNESSLLDTLDEEDRAAADPSGSTNKPADERWTDSWDQALSLFDRYSWHRLAPQRVHPDFADRLAMALALKGIDPERNRKWREALIGAGWSPWSRSDSSRTFSPRYDAALILSAVAHSTQNRKGTSIPYSAHPVHVARILEHAGLDENVILAGLLHDVVEDLKPDEPMIQQRFREVYPSLHWPIDPEEFKSQVKRLIESQFGPGVLKLVQAVSEEKAADGVERPWKVRKLEQLEHLTKASPAVAALKCVDSLHNVASILRDMQEKGTENAVAVLKRFNAGPDDVLWYYGTVSAVVAERLLEEHRYLARDLERTVSALEQEVDRACGPRDTFTGERKGFPGRASTGMVALSRSGRRIYSLDQWRRFAPPARGDDQWKDQRSAKELARAWFSGFEPAVPEEVVRVFRTSDTTVSLKIRTIFAEHQTELDSRGPGRQHDLLAHGTAGARKVVIGFEAKADESFGPAIGEYLRKADVGNERRRAEGRRLSGVPDRIEELAKHVFGHAVNDQIRGLRYQLLHATAAVKLEAAGADLAVMVVHEFLSKACDRRRVELNTADLVQYMRTLDPTVSSEHLTQLTGPFPSKNLGEPPLYIAKATRKLQSGEISGPPGAGTQAERRQPSR